MDKLKCKLHGYRYNGGLYRIKQHITGIRKNVKAYSVAKEDDRKKFKATLDKKKLRKRRDRNNNTKLGIRSN